MAVRIVVEKGPDKGKSILLETRAEVRIGRGPGNHLMMQDPAWQGTLRVVFAQGVCKVTNQTSTTVYLGEKTFTPGEQRPWFHGESLQPTAQTLLVLYVDDANKSETAEGSSQARKRMQLAIVLVCLPVAVVLFLLPSGPDANQARTPEAVQKEYRRLEGRLQELHEEADGGEAAGRVLALLKEARFEQQRKHPARAFALYHRVREEIEADQREPLNPRPLPEEIAKTMQEVQEFVNQQLIELGPQARKKSS